MEYFIKSKVSGCAVASGIEELFFKHLRSAELVLQPEHLRRPEAAGEVPAPGGFSGQQGGSEWGWWPGRDGGRSLEADGAL